MIRSKHQGFSGDQGNTSPFIILSYKLGGPRHHDKGAGHESEQPVRLLERDERPLGYRRHRSREKRCSDDYGTHLPMLGIGSPKTQVILCISSGAATAKAVVVAVDKEAGSKSNRRWESVAAAAAGGGGGGGVGGAVAVAVQWQ